MKRCFTILVAALLVIAMLCACGGQEQSAPQVSPPPTSAEPVPAVEIAAEEHQEHQPPLEEAAGDLAFAAAMACWDLGLNSVGEEEDLSFLWDASGWYAAWLCRVRQVDLLTEAELRDIQLALGGSRDTDLAQGEMYTSLHRLQNSDASFYYDFDQHKLRMDELLGVELEVSSRTETDDTLRTAVTKHFDDGRTVTWAYMLVFEKNSDESSSFSWRLSSVKEVSGVTTEEALTFTWDELMAANRLENILSIYPAVKISNRTYDNGIRTWYFSHGDEPAMVEIGDGVCSGLYHGCWFDYDELPEGGRRVRIGARSPEKAGWDGLGGEICDYFANVAAIRLDRFDGDLIRIFCDMRIGETVSMAVDRGTLVLREVAYRYSEDFEPSVVVLEYLEPTPDCSFLDGWDQELRTVTVMWEDWPAPPVSETAEIPMDWEYLPYEARWGNYTAYLNENYTGEYAYPGDGVDYTLYLTTTKG